MQALKGVQILYSDDDPVGLLAGRKWVALLREQKCPNYRLYISYVQQAVKNGTYTYEELGSSAEEVLSRAIDHAGTQVIEAGRYFLVDLAIKNQLQCELGKLQEQKRSNGSVVNLNEKLALLAA